MASQKRGGGFNHYGRDQHSKKHQGTHPQQRAGNRPSNPPQLSRTDMQTGLVALLDRFVADETTPGADKAILHHAHELRRLLCARNDSASSTAKRELDEKRPEIGRAHV